MTKEIIVRSYEAERDRRVIRLTIAITMFVVGIFMIKNYLIFGLILMLPTAIMVYKKLKKKNKLKKKE